MAPFTSWLPAHPNQDFDLVVKFVGPAVSGLVKDWIRIAQFLIQKGLSVMMQQGRLNGEFGDFVLDIRLATRPFYSMGHGCDVLVDLGDTAHEYWRVGLQPGSLLLWEPTPENGLRPILPAGVIAYPVPLKDLCLRHGEGLMGVGLAAMGALFHLLGIPETTLWRWAPSLSAPRSFAAGCDYARHDIEKRDVHALPLGGPASSRAMLLSPQQAILLGYAASACECQTACDAELITSPGRWTAKHLGIAGSMVSVLESDGHPGAQVYRGPAGKVMALLRENDAAIASCLSGFKAPVVFLAADIPDAFHLVLAGYDHIRRGLTDRVVILIEESIALRHQSVDVCAMAEMIRRRNTIAQGPVGHSHWASGEAMVERDGDVEADVGFVAWGAAQGVVRDAVALCRNFGLRVAGFYLKRIGPFQREEMESFAKSVGRVVVVESGQPRGHWDRVCTSVSFDYSMLRPPPGRSLTPMDIFLREGLGGE